MGAHAYSVTNALSGLAASAFTWSNGATTSRSYLNDNRMDRRMVIGSSVASGVNVVIDLGSAQALMGFAILNSNAAAQKSDATVRVRGADDAGISVNVVTAKAASTLYAPSIPPRNKDHVLQFAAVTKRYWELTWTWTGNVTNFSIGELWAYAAATQLSRRSVYDSADGKKFFTASEQFQVGERRGVFLGGPQRSLELAWSDLSSTERDELDTMWGLVNGDVAPFLFIPSYEATATAGASSEQDCVFGRLEDSELVFQNPDFGRYAPRKAFVVRSAGREAGA
jgi:hypothetical protein